VEAIIMKGGGRRVEENRIYANPLPIVFSSPEPSSTTSMLGLLGLSRNLVLNPHCEGVYDEITRSVWVVNKRDVLVLWRRGFFGKGDLSRSEPTWLARKINSKRMAAKKGMYTH
jgi:tRNA-splicing endonuclease subunit Sen2